MDQRYQIGSVVFGTWTIRRKLGEGSFGKVFEIQREDFGEVYKACLLYTSGGDPMAGGAAGDYHCDR